MSIQAAQIQAEGMIQAQILSEGMIQAARIPTEGMIQAAQVQAEIPERPQDKPRNVPK